VTRRGGRSCAALVAAAALAVAALPSGAAAGAAPVPPKSPVGSELAWLLGATAYLPLSDPIVTAHFDATFLTKVSPATLNAVLEQQTPGLMRLLGLADVTPDSLVATVAVDGNDFTVRLRVDAAGLIEGQLLAPTVSANLTSWSAVDGAIRALAPRVSLLAAKLGSGGTCRAVHAIAPAAARPLGSMFKLFVLGALAEDISAHRISWDQKLTVTASSKVGGSGTLVTVPDGRVLTVRQVATAMISVSDNTAADLLLGLVGRAAVERQVARWAAHPDLDVPFLTVSELFALKYDYFPALADHYLSLDRVGRAAYLASTIDSVTAAEETAATVPRDVGSIEWFASPQDMCRAFAGLDALQATPGLGPIGTVLSMNDGGVALPRSTWSRVWFKGGSEAGVLTLGYLARDTAGRTFVVVAMLENPTTAIDEETASIRLLDVVSSAFALLHRSA